MQSALKYLMAGVLVVSALSLAALSVVGVVTFDMQLSYLCLLFVLIVTAGYLTIALGGQKLARSLETEDVRRGSSEIERSRLQWALPPALTVFLGLVATATALGLIAVLLVYLFAIVGLAALVLLIVSYSWMLSSYVRYRHGRQVELQQLLTMATEAGAPLAPALRAYLRDRPRGAAREIWVAVLLFFVIPGYYWLWHRRNNFDQKVGRVVARLEQGSSLYEALEAVPGVAPGELLLAVKIGESTGQLARCMGATSTGRLAAVWLEIMPTLIYPVAMLVFISLVAGFWIVFLLPKMEKIYRDFGAPLPETTRLVSRFGNVFANYLWLVVLGALGLIQLVSLNWSSTFRWHVPGLGRLYRMHVQSRVLRMLGILLAAGKTVPDALALLAKSRGFSRQAKRRLDVARAAVEQGRSLAVSLQEAELLQPAMVTLVQSAERAQHLPWALSELGESQLNRLIRLLKRGSMILFPANVLLIGALVAFLVLGMFMPLIGLLTRLSE